MLPKSLLEIFVEGLRRARFSKQAEYLSTANNIAQIIKVCLARQKHGYHFFVLLSDFFKEICTIHSWHRKIRNDYFKRPLFFKDTQPFVS